MREKLIYWLLKTSSKEEQLKIITEMIFQLLGGYHIHKNPVVKPSKKKESAMRKFDSFISDLKDDK